MVNFAIHSAGQIIAGGDSGGAIFVNGTTGAPLSIVAVNSRCGGLEWVAGMPQNWTWITTIKNCQGAAITPLRDEIVREIRRHPLCTLDPKGACAVPPIASYALN